MALAPDNTVPYVVSFIVEDDEGNTSSCSLYLPATLTVAALDVAIPELGANIAALSDGKLISANVTRKYVDPVAKAAAAPGTAEVEFKGVFTFGGAGNTRASIGIPAIKAIFTPAKSDDIDVTIPAVAEFVSEMINLTIGPANSPVDSRGGDLTVLLDAYESHRNRKRS